MERIDAQVGLLQVRRRQVEASHAALARVARLMAMPAEPGAIPPVRAHPERGGRGAFRNFLREALRSAYPAARDTVTLSAAAMEQFGLRFASAVEFQQFRRNQVLRTLAKLVDRGEIVRLHERRTGINSIGIWRWKADEPSLVDLLADPHNSEG
jgi:hypothetical protein